MFKYYNKLLFILVVLVLHINLSANMLLHSQSPPIGKVFSLEYPGEKNIYFGPYLTDDNTIMNFVLESFVPDSLIVAYGSPTFIIEEPAGTPTLEYVNFEENLLRINDFPLTFHTGKLKDTIKVPFTALPTQALGRKEARLVIGFVYKSNPDSPVAVFADTFHIIGKASTLYIDGYDDFVRFDSVFINQPVPITKTWKVRNTYRQRTALPAVGQEYSLLSVPYAGNEFEVEQKNYPIQFYFSEDNKVCKEWTFSYNPKDTIKDTAEMRLLFQPEPQAQPDKIDTAKVQLYGIGVSQHFEVIRHSAVQISGDTIDIGQVSVNQNKTVNITLRSRGNISYKMKSQALLAEFDEEQDALGYFQIIRALDSSRVLQNTDIDSFQVEFFPRAKGEFFVRYVIENNYKDRGILSNNPADYKKTFIIKGTGMAPTLQLSADTVHFGNINSTKNNANCPLQKDTTITIFNTGNQELRVYDMQSSNAMFQVGTPSPLSIAPYSSHLIKLTFTANNTPALYAAALVLHTNLTSQPEDTVWLLANAIPPISADLSLPSLSAKPGTTLNVPIVISAFAESNQQAIIDHVSTFDITLAYNSTLLAYNNEITGGTATAGCVIEADTSQAGRLRIMTSKDAKFQPYDTLIILRFNTFLGNYRQTELSFVNAKFGVSTLCDDYISLTLHDGAYSIDSICGLDYKTGATNGQFDYAVASGVNADAIDVSFTLPYEYKAQVEIYNAVGNVIDTYPFALPAGQHNQTLPVAHLETGVFYSVFTCGLYRKVVPFIKQP